MQWILFMIIGSLISVLGGGFGPIIDTRYANLIKNGLLILWFGSCYGS